MWFDVQINSTNPNFSAIKNLYFNPEDKKFYLLFI